MPTGMPAAPALTDHRVAPTQRHNLYRAGVKRLLDLSLVVIATPFVLPIVFVLAVLVSIDGGPPFFRQARLGRNGRTFQMLKLRTMVEDADDRLAEYLADNPDARAEWEQNQKLRHDPRVTRVGAILRKLSLDELPQLWNVLCGDMSLVGPRPMMPNQKVLYPGQAYWRLRPGLTGPWQVSARNRTSFAARAEFDQAYEATCSLFYDLRLLVATAGVVLRGTGR